MKRVETAYANAGEVQQVQNFIKTKYFPAPAPLYKQYATHFNNVDMGDKQVGKGNDKHKIMDWHSKMEQTIRKIAIYNVWVFYCQQSYSKIVDFRQELALKLLKIRYE